MTYQLIEIDTLETAEMLDDELNPIELRQMIIKVLQDNCFSYHLNADMTVVMHLESVDRDGRVSIEYIKCPTLAKTFEEMGY